MKYYEVKIHIAPTAVEIITGFLSTYGINDIEIKDISSDESDMIFYLNADNESEKLIQTIKIDGMKLKSDELYGVYDSLGRMYVESSIVDDEDWKHKWKEDFTSFEASSRIGVQPSWDNNAPDSDIIIKIDPGMAFGTGKHETTKLCLECLESTLKENDKLLDIGTGSGILSIAAIMLGAAEAMAVDVDSDATTVAKNNFLINDVADRIKIKTADVVSGIDYKADLIVANLVSSLIIKIADSIKHNINENGIFIFSGILIEETETVIKALNESGYRSTTVMQEGEWSLIKAVRDE